MNDNSNMNNFDNFNDNQDININGDINNYDNNNMNEGGPNPDQNKNYKISDFYKKSSNPSVALTTVSLKLAAIFFFLFLNIIAGEAFVMIVVIVLVSGDFWYTKNIAGRTLVGLRWWNTYKPETQQDIWTFESKNEIKESNMDRRTFWISLYGFTAIWLVLFIWECVVFNFVWAFLCLISLAISGVNTYGFFRCSKLQQNAAIKIMKKYIKKSKKNEKN